jgi:hypothetical protein
MLVVKITGGLGNQLFQFAFGQYLSKQINTNVLYDIQTNKNQKKITSRNLELQNLNFKLEIASIKDIYEFKFFTKGVLARIERKVAELMPFFNKKFIVENSMHKLVTKSIMHDNCYYDGYWQCIEYVEINKDIFKNQISLIKDVDNKNTLLINKIRSSQSISVHIRRGDYITIKKNSAIFHICGLDYYKTAIRFIEQKVSNPQYYIFSDDIEWAKKNFIGSEYTYVEGNEPYLDMYLMSLCKHNIIANSTFSWWGAWLNESKDKIVIAPEKWYISDLNNNLTNFIHRDWIRI